MDFTAYIIKCIHLLHATVSQQRMILIGVCRFNMNKSNIWLGALLCFFAAAAWGAMFPVAESAMEHIDPFWFTSLRYGSVAIILCSILWIKEGKRAFRLEHQGFKLWLFGTFAFTVYNFFVFWGQHQLGKSGVILASITESLMPMLGILLMWVVTRKRPNPGTLACVLLAFVGVIFVVTKGELSVFSSGELQAIPLIAIFIGVVGWVFYTVGGGQFKGWSALRYSTLTCLLGTLTSIVFTGLITLSGAIEVPTISQVQPIMPEMLFMIFVAGLAALLAWMRGIQLLTPVNGMLFINFVPATTFLITVIQGYEVSAAEWLGTALIVGALIINNVHSRISIKQDKPEQNSIPLKQPARASS